MVHIKKKNPQKIVSKVKNTQFLNFLPVWQIGFPKVIGSLNISLKKM